MKQASSRDTTSREDGLDFRRYAGKSREFQPVRQCRHRPTLAWALFYSVKGKTHSGVPPPTRRSTEALIGKWEKSNLWNAPNLTTSKSADPTLLLTRRQRAFDHVTLVANDISRDHEVELLREDFRDPLVRETGVQLQARERGQLMLSPVMPSSLLGPALAWWSGVAFAGRFQRLGLVDFVGSRLGHVSGSVGTAQLGVGARTGWTYFRHFESCFRFCCVVR